MWREPVLGSYRLRVGAIDWSDPDGDEPERRALFVGAILAAIVPILGAIPGLVCAAGLGKRGHVGLAIGLAVWSGAAAVIWYQQLFASNTLTP